MPISQSASNNSKQPLPNGTDTGRSSSGRLLRKQISVSLQCTAPVPHFPFQLDLEKSVSFFSFFFFLCFSIISFYEYRSTCEQCVNWSIEYCLDNQHRFLSLNIFCLFVFLKFEAQHFYINIYIYSTIHFFLSLSFLLRFFFHT